MCALSNSIVHRPFLYLRDVERCLRRNVSRSPRSFFNRVLGPTLPATQLFTLGEKMNVLKLLHRAAIFLCMSALAFFVFPPGVRAQWRATVGAQDKSLGHQALAFLPNEIWIHVGDTVTWTSAVEEIHTVTFLKLGQTRLPFQVGCPGFSLGASASFDGSTCLTTPPLVNGQKFTVTFPTAGNFKLVCLVHQNMTGVVHVLDFSQPLPHAQGYYDDQAADQREDLLSDADNDNEQ